MGNHYYLSLINFKVKTSLPETFFFKLSRYCIFIFRAPCWLLSPWCHAVRQLKLPTWRSNTPQSTMFTMSPKSLNIQHRVHFKKFFDNEVLL